MTQIANYRTAINSTLQILAGLPAPLINEFTGERTVLGLGANAVGAVLADCKVWHHLIGHWIARVGIWAEASKQSGVDN